MDCREALFFLRFRRPGLPGPGDFAPEDAAALDQHIASCPGCAAEAKAAIAFDAAVGSAMRAVEMPSGLRDRLFVAASVQRGAILRRKAYQWVALAASILLAVGIGTGIFTATRPEPDTYELVAQANRIESTMRFQVPVIQGFDADLARANEEVLNAFLKSERLPPLPRPNGHTFDPTLIVNQHFEEVQGRQVPVILVRGRDGGFAKIYAFRPTQFKVKGLAEGQGVSDSNCQAMYFPADRGIVYVVVFTGRDLDPFLSLRTKPGIPV